jgi:hypothetical protein
MLLKKQIILNICLFQPILKCCFFKNYKKLSKLIVLFINIFIKQYTYIYINYYIYINIIYKNKKIYKSKISGIDG